MKKFTIYFSEAFLVHIYFLEKITHWCNFTKNFKPLKFIKIHSNQLLKLNKTFLYSSIHFGPAYRNSNRSINNSVRPSLPQQPTFARCPHPGRNLGLGRQSGLPLAPAWAESRPMLPSPSDFIRRPSDRFGRTKWLIRPRS